MRDPLPIYELLVVSAWADGIVKPEEVLAVQRIVAADEALSRIGNRSEIARAVKDRITAKGIDAVLREIAPAIAPEDRELAFRLCAKVVNADGEMAGEDADVLGTLQELFGLPAAAVTRLIR